MKKIALILLLFSFFNGQSQTLSEKKILKLNKLNLEVENLNLNDINIQKNLNEILKLNRKTKINRTLAIYYRISALTGIIYGGLITYGPQHPIRELIGGLYIASGVLCAGVSIPLWKASKKRKKERNELIKTFR